MAPTNLSDTSASTARGFSIQHPVPTLHADEDGFETLVRVGGQNRAVHLIALQKLAVIGGEKIGLYVFGQFSAHLLVDIAQPHPFDRRVLAREFRSDAPDLPHPTTARPMGLLVSTDKFMSVTLIRVLIQTVRTSID